MLTENAKNGFETLLMQCLTESLKTNSDPDWKLQAIDTLDEVNEAEFFMLTLSSFTFKSFVLLHFTRNESTMKYVENALQITNEVPDESKFYDFLGEIGNGFCGGLKRELGNYLPNLGMSTPNRLTKQSLTHITALDCDFETHFSASSEGSILFYGSLYVRSYNDMDFRIQHESIGNDVESGELEFF